MHDYHHHGNAEGNIAVAFWLNFGFFFVELIGGILTNSVAILSDALHDLGDSMGLLLSWYFHKKSKTKRTVTFSYGYRRFSLLGAVINSVILIVGAVVVLSETLPRLFHPQAVKAEGVLALAVLGVLVNGVAALRLRKGSSLNEKIAALHIWEDVFGWLAVLVGALVMMLWNVPIIDPILSLIITSFVLVNVFKRGREILKVFLQAIPDSVDMGELTRDLKAVSGVEDLHDLHIWTMDSEHHVLSVHLVIDAANDFSTVQCIKEETRRLLHEKYDIDHATIEVELYGDDCQLADC